MIQAPTQRNIVIGISVFVIIASLSFWADSLRVGDALKGSGWSIMPPLVAVVLALITHRMSISLLIAVIMGGFLTHVPGDPGSAAAWGQGFLQTPKILWSTLTDSFNQQVIAFVMLVLAMIAVLLAGGGLDGIVKWLHKYAKSAKSTQMVTALMGLAVFIDDYANTLIVGSAMRPTTDDHKISREKLAFLVDATAAPVAGIAFVSTWIGYEVGLFGEVSQSLGLGVDGYAMFFDAILFRFYCLLMLVFVFANVYFGVDYGPMAKAERRASKGKVQSDDAEALTSSLFASIVPSKGTKPLARVALISFAVMFSCVFGGLWLDGGGAAVLAESPLSILNPVAWRDVIAASENNAMVLMCSAGVGLVTALILTTQMAGLKVADALKSAASGAKGSLLPAAILILAWSLKASCDALETGPFLISVLGNIFSPLWFPAILFLLAGLTAFATGTSWATMAILIPTAIPLAYSLDGNTYGLVTMISLGAILDGAIFGDHCSPISDTTIMSSISSSCDHIAHVRTQMPYALTVAVIAVVFGYIPAAFGLPGYLGFALGSAVIIGLAYFMSRQKKREVIYVRTH